MASQAVMNPWREALDQALDELAQAEHSFEWADPDFCDYYIYRIQAAKEKVALILRQARVAYGIQRPAMLTGTAERRAISASPEDASSSGA
ncbi:hypothetical protein [Sulfobacillus harzensis]|uniref:Uncharacterized protein n=1 Tax=Sulfobacillus harzensis TaxID=2729629 RepID=A0A7Y0L0I4_9FIRM|nr:hypothetical protein [Sulfobacillus harzensis]NMP21066.1 hypothetical protein [Sulfobacillus harzensis]